MASESALKSVLEEELERNLKKQVIFNDELEKLPKGSLSIVTIHNDEYLYRKYRKGNKVISEYIGPIDGDSSKEAYKLRERFLKLKQAIKDLKKEERYLKRALHIHD